MAEAVALADADAPEVTDSDAVEAGVAVEADDAEPKLVAELKADEDDETDAVEVAVDDEDELPENESCPEPLALVDEVVDSNAVALADADTPEVADSADVAVEKPVVDSRLVGLDKDDAEFKDDAEPALEAEPSADPEDRAEAEEVDVDDVEGLADCEQDSQTVSAVAPQAAATAQAQLVHAVHATAPGRLAYEPLAQAVHADVPAARAAYVPLAQAVHTSEVAAAAGVPYVPAPHAAHTSEVVAAVASL